MVLKLRVLFSGQVSPFSHLYFDQTVLQKEVSCFLVILPSLTVFQLLSRHGNEFMEMGVELSIAENLFIIQEEKGKHGCS